MSWRNVQGDESDFPAQQLFWESGVAAQCDTCDRYTICKPVTDADDPLDALRSAWICRMCWYPGDADG